MNYKQDSSNDDVPGITVKIKKGDSDPASLARPSFFDALQHVSSPFERMPLSDSTYQNYPLSQLVTLSFFENGARTSINYDPHKELITIEDSSEEYHLNKGGGIHAILECIMIDHGKHHSFFISNLSEMNVKK
ncbi:hypothetical protein [Peribacillus muralis]|uniref:hypothetical protein n=1 Tax=Peribacillus muralis TaxID=264697 RepID=UPI003670EC6C